MEKGVIKLSGKRSKPFTTEIIYRYMSRIYMWFRYNVYGGVACKVKLPNELALSCTTKKKTLWNQTERRASSILFFPFRL